MGRTERQYSTDDTGVVSALADAAQLYAERRQEYGPSERRFGAVMGALFPDGVDLRSDHEWARYGVLVQIVGKITRYTAHPHTGHADSARDLGVYAFMLADLDATAAVPAFPPESTVKLASKKRRTQR